MSVLAFLIAGYSIVQYIVLDAQQAGFVQLKLMLNATLHSLWFIVLYIHIIFGVLALIIGPFTLSSKLRENNVKRHRILGKL
ncbi:Predicted membrane protein [Lysinibacillus fusiformis]|uniref:Predicted membrane protein n=2 Tax=Lysinibacillus fusiformis TaxID=28031 RepID=A0A1H9B5D6_9BACI|nr:Predicted membrane protein [Lysinibacillus fusiformis]SEM75069.1 Predicted membrane protein [Lysinibacillus fusiformis]SEP83458.1 Predicted membrane protein [Lysinibacillus fusiformis]